MGIDIVQNCATWFQIGVHWLKSHKDSQNVNACFAISGKYIQNSQRSWDCGKISETMCARTQIENLHVPHPKRINVFVRTISLKC